MARQDIFQEITGFKDFNVSGQSFRVPIRYRKLDMFFAVYTADRLKVLAALPSPRLKPIPVWPGRVLVALNAFNYLDTDVGAYGEFSVGFPCTCSHQGRTRFGVYVHRLPVTTEVARVAGIEVWGYPKFIAEMQFEDHPESRGLRMTAAGKHVLDLRVGKGGFGWDQKITLATFTVKDGQIVCTKITSRAMLRARPWGQAWLRTGPHEMGEELFGLGLSAGPIAVGDFLDINLLLPEGERLGAV